MTEIKDNKELLIHAGEGTQGRKSMVSINIQDGTELIKLACEDLQAGYSDCNLNVRESPGVC